MPLAIGESINHLADTFLKSPTLHALCKNPISTAITIAFVVMLIALYIYRDATTVESLLTTAARLALLSFFTTVGIIFLHDKVLTTENVETVDRHAYADIYAPRNNIGVGAADVVPVVPSHQEYVL